VGQHHRTGSDLSERGSTSVTGIVVFFLLIFLLVIGTNWVDDDLELGAFRTVVSEAAEEGALEGAPGGAQTACYETAAQAEADLVPRSLMSSILVTCTLEELPSGAQLLVAVASGPLANWVVPATLHVHVVASAPVETNPGQPATVDP
jgi:hypothetical protein